MVGDALLLIFSDLVGYDGQPLIKLHCISIDNFSIVLARYLNRQLPTVISIDSASA
jgi:hypothetical protein